MTYTEGEVLLQIEDVSKEYNGHLVLNHVNAIIKDIRVTGTVKGQIVGFIGPSGIGKSTLLRILAGLDVPTSGAVVIDGSGRPVRAGEVGVVAQNYPLFAHRTVFGNLLRAARKQYKDKDARDKVVGYLAEFDLSSVVHSYPHQLSGGQRQRVAILQQILIGHQILLLDEPFSGLDPVAKRKAQELIKKVADLDEKNTIIIVTHDIPAAVACCDHIWALGRNRDTTGAPIPGAFIVETYNLIDAGLAWTENISKNPLFIPFVNSLEERFATL